MKHGAKVISFLMNQKVILYKLTIQKGSKQLQSRKENKKLQSNPF